MAQQGIDEGSFPEQARLVLEESLLTTLSLLPTPDLAAPSMIGAYLARTVKDNIDCDRCLLLLVKASCAPVDHFILHQDRGGLLYPCTTFLHVLYSLKFIEALFGSSWKDAKEPLKASRQECRGCAFRTGQTEMCQS